MKQATMTVKEVADYFRVHPDMIYSLVKEKQIPHMRLGNRILFTKKRSNVGFRIRKREAYKVRINVGSFIVFLIMERNDQNEVILKSLHSFR